LIIRQLRQISLYLPFSFAYNLHTCLINA
jgi:hypothetical protein